MNLKGLFGADLKEIDPDKTYIIVIESRTPKEDLDAIVENVCEIFDGRQGMALVLRGPLPLQDFSLSELKKFHHIGRLIKQSEEVRSPEGILRYHIMQNDTPIQMTFMEINQCESTSSMATSSSPKSSNPSRKPFKSKATPSSSQASTSTTTRT